VALQQEGGSGGGGDDGGGGGGAARLGLGGESAGGHGLLGCGSWTVQNEPSKILNFALVGGAWGGAIPAKRMQQLKVGRGWAGGGLRGGGKMATFGYFHFPLRAIPGV
jgi:hypothetical protein